MLSKTLGIVFSNMHDTMMGKLTENRTMASVPFGGRYRLVDFVLSNMINSDVKDVGIITKSNYQSLMDHVGNGKEWDLSRKNGGLTILPPYGRMESVFYRGRLEALGNIYSYIKESKAELVIMTDCDNIASIDYSDILRYHKGKDADVTVVYQNKAIADSVHRDVTTISMAEHHRHQQTSARANRGRCGQHQLLQFYPGRFADGQPAPENLRIRVQWLCC